MERCIKYLSRCFAKKLGERPNVRLTEKSTNLRLPYAKYQVLYSRYFNRHFDNTKISSIVDTSNWIPGMWGNTITNFRGSVVPFYG